MPSSAHIAGIGQQSTAGGGRTSRRKLDQSKSTGRINSNGAKSLERKQSFPMGTSNDRQVWTHRATQSGVQRPSSKLKNVQSASTLPRKTYSGAHGNSKNIDKSDGTTSNTTKNHATPGRGIPIQQQYSQLSMSIGQTPNKNQTVQKTMESNTD